MAAMERPAAKEHAEEAAVAEAPLDHHRLILGMLMPIGTGGLGGGSVGALAPPAAHVSYEARMSGPAWFMLGLRGAISGYNGPGYGEERVSLGGFAGVRLEAPIHEYVAVGGYGVFGASGDASGSSGVESSNWHVGLDFGAGLHFRPTRLFGVRLGVEVLSLGYARSSYEDQVARSAFAELKASPSVELTFSF